MRLLIVLSLIALAAFLMTGCAGSSEYKPDVRYNIYEKRWEMASPAAELKYNIYEKEWQYAE